MAECVLQGSKIQPWIEGPLTSEDERDENREKEKMRSGHEPVGKGIWSQNTNIYP